MILSWPFLKNPSVWLHDKICKNTTNLLGVFIFHVTVHYQRYQVNIHKEQSLVYSLCMLCFPAWSIMLWITVHLLSLWVNCAKITILQIHGYWNELIEHNDISHWNALTLNIPTNSNVWNKTKLEVQTQGWTISCRLYAFSQKHQNDAYLVWSYPGYGTPPGCCHSSN